MILVFDLNGLFVMAAGDVPASHNNSNYKIAELPDGEEFDPEFEYSVNSVDYPDTDDVPAYTKHTAVRGDAILVDAVLAAQMAAEFATTQYQRDRRYPPIGDQLDALFHAGVFPDDMADKLQAVKDAHPKP
jgi:hypothetical protein